MYRKSRQAWVAAALLAAALAWAGTGCDDGNGSDGTGTTDTSGDGSLLLPAPQLIKPVDGAYWEITPGYVGATVMFEWGAVAGAEGYYLAYKTASTGDFKTFLVKETTAGGHFPKGTNYWKVAALVDGRPQTWSETRYFIFK